MPDAATADVAIAPGVCGACRRTWDEGRTTCLYCGWSPAHPEHTAGLDVPRRRHRQGRTLARFALASAALVPFAAWTIRELVIHGPNPLDCALTALALVCGPLVLLVQFLRRAGSAVELSRAGIEHDGVVIAWSRVRSVDRTGVEISADRGARATLSVLARGRSSTGTVLSGMHVGGMLGFFLGPFALVLYVAVPAFVLLSPWCPGVVVHIANGGVITLRDLEQAEPFVRAIRARIAGPARQAQ